MSDSDTEKLVVRAKDGDTAALELLLVKYWDSLCDHIARRIPSSADLTISAEDMTQEALVEAFLKIDRLREATPRVFLAWLKALGEMCLARCLRHQGRQKRGGQVKRIHALQVSSSAGVLDLLDELPADVKTASSLLARSEALAAMQVAVASLPDDQRRAIQLHVFQGQTLEETAATMERTAAAVRGLVHRGKQKVTESMGRASTWFGEK